jgi:hypothetical protein
MPLGWFMMNTLLKSSTKVMRKSQPMEVGFDVGTGAGMAVGVLVGCAVG